MATQPTTTKLPTTNSGRRLNWLLIALPIVLFALTAMRFHNRSGDLEVYVEGGDRMVHGRPIFLRTGQPDAIQPPFTYPPFFAFVFIPIALLPESMHRTAWALVFTISLTAIFRMLYLCVRPLLPAEPGARRKALRIFWVGVALLAGRHVLSIWEVQSNDILTLLLTVTCVYAICRAKYLAAGLTAGVAAACKATPLFFAPVFVWQRRWGAAMCVGAATVGMTLLTDLATPSASGTPWVVSWYQGFLRNVKPGEAVDEPGGWPKWSEANQSLAGTLYRMMNAPEPFRTEERDVSIVTASPQTTKYVTMGSQLIVLGLVMWGTRNRRSAVSLARTAAADNELWLYRLGQGAIIVTAMPLLSPMSSKSHFGVLIVPVAYCLAAEWNGRRDALTRVLLVVMFAVGTLTVKGIVGNSLGRYILGYGTVTWCAVAGLLAAARTMQLQTRSWASLEIGGTATPLKAKPPVAVGPDRRAA